MRYKIKDIPPEGRRVRETLERSLLDEALEGGLADPARTSGAVDVELTKSHDDVFARGTLTATLGLACSACLQPISLDVKAPIDMVYRLVEPMEEEVEGDPLEEQETGTHDGKEVDLQPIVREQLILSLPVAPRCQESCKGLCPTCGADRNVTNCGCSQQSLESPFAASLKGIKLT